MSSTPTPVRHSANRESRLGESCPLCGSPLRPDQDWCLRCGTAARTRLAAPPKWKGLILTAVALALISLAVLIVALVKLAE